MRRGKGGVKAYDDVRTYDYTGVEQNTRAFLESLQQKPANSDLLLELHVLHSQGHFASWMYILLVIKCLTSFI